MQAQRAELRVEKLVATGRALARHEGRVVFLDSGYPGDLVLAELTGLRKDYAEARALRILEPGTPRQSSACSRFGRCGGCDWLDLDEERQLALERQIAEDAFGRLLSPAQTSAILQGPLASPRRLAYRRRARLKVGEEGAVGFYRRGSHAIEPIPDCPVLVPRLEAMLPGLGELAREATGLREIQLLAGSRAAGVALIARDRLRLEPQEVAARLGAQSVDFEDGSGRTHGGGVEIEVGGFVYEAPVRCFFQGNAAFDELLLGQVLRPLAGAGGKVLELYCGVGLFTVPLAASGREVVAAELDGAACAAARRNLARAGLRAKVLNLDASGIGPSIGRLRPEAVLVDPPRTGLDRAVREALARSGASTIVYLACDLTTQARDLKALEGAYRLESLQLLDLFPQTAHLESLAVLRARR